MYVTKLAGLIFKIYSQISVYNITEQTFIYKTSNNQFD